MFSIGFYFVFSVLASAIYGLLVFIALVLFIATIAVSYDIVRNYLKKLNKEKFYKSLLFNKNVIVTGGSSGIGKAVAVLAARYGANVTLIARNADRLEAALAEVSKAAVGPPAQRIEALSLDVGCGEYGPIERAFGQHEASHGPCHLLVNCAGTAVCGRIEDTDPHTLRKLVNLNLVGSYYCTKAVVPAMKRARDGRVVLVASQAALIGIFGYSAYCSTKFGLRGLAESLAMELTPYNVSVTLSLPPDTDTPGFAVEEQTKPLETKLISETAALVKPEEVADKILSDALDKRFFSFIGLESFMVTTLCCGMSPYSCFSELILQSTMMGPFRLVSAFLLYSFQNIVIRCMKEREKHKKCK